MFRLYLGETVMFSSRDIKKVTNFFVVLFIFFPLESMQPDPKMVILANGEHTFSVLRDIACKYSETINAVLAGSADEQKLSYISFTLIKPKALEEFSKFFNLLGKYNNLREKQLFDAIESELTVQKRIDFLRAAHFLESDIAINFMARILAKWANRKVEKKKAYKFRKLQEQIYNKFPNTAAEQINDRIVRYWLLTKKENTGLIELYENMFLFQSLFIPNNS